MTPKTPHTAGQPGRFPRIRGRHRKPRPRKVLLAAGGLALAAGAVTVIRLTSAPDGGTDIGVEAGPRPTPHAESTTPTTASPPPSGRATTPAPEASPSSPEALGGKNKAPLTPPEQSPTPRTTPPTTTPETATPPRNTAPKTPPPDTPRTHNSPPPDRGEPAPNHPDGPPPKPKPTPKPKPEPEPDPGLCVPIIGLCIGAVDAD
ncbi:hypothetical protein ACIQCD_22355 [Streptomyces sp. NPDC093250]|uniref:hypothetical protein n=1 Tax=Streptomyces sp. NPDC093250 TaxID=3366036 RepID=UPI00381503BF